MRRAAAQSVAPHTSSRVVGRGVPLAEGALGFANVMHAKCIAPPARAVGRRRRCLFSRALTDLCIAVIVTRRSAVVVRTNDARAGHVHDQDGGESRRFIRVRPQTVQPQGAGSWYPVGGAAAEPLRESTSPAQTQDRDTASEASSCPVMQHSMVLGAWHRHEGEGIVSRSWCDEGFFG